MTLQIPNTLKKQIVEGKAVLFLGSGASLGAKKSSGDEMYTVSALRDKLLSHFFADRTELKNRQLSQIADFVEVEFGRKALLDALFDLFSDFEPAAFHLLIPLFPWAAIVTTNYDLIVENSYKLCEKNARNIVTYINQNEDFEGQLKLKANSIPFLKIHGCISNSSDMQTPLIISKDHLTKYKKNRELMFDYLRDLAERNTVIFCGYSIEDQHLRNLLFDLTDETRTRPRYYYNSPNQTDLDTNYWGSHRVEVLNCDFETFLKALTKCISETERDFSRIILRGDLSLKTHYQISEPAESDELVEFLQKDVWHVHSSLVTEKASPRQFYSGFDNSWTPIINELDVSRSIADAATIDGVLCDSEQIVQLYLIKGPAGNGKSVILKRIAYTAAESYDKLVLHLRPDGAIKFSAIKEISDLTNKRIYLFIDHAAIHASEISNLIRFCYRSKIKVTIFLSERENEWNMRCSELDGYLDADFTVPYLNKKEIYELLEKLEVAQCLGTLEEMSPENRFKAFHENAKRQLLVALHEATQGLPFENIVVDEYNRILPEEAQHLYLDICTLNRLGVAVRAGLISRASGISFDMFQSDFFRPLESIVRHRKDPYSGEIYYEARHSHIAEIVFDQILNNENDRYDHIIRLLSEINIEYQSDKEAFNAIMRGRGLAQAFSDIELGRDLFKRGFQRVGEPAFLLQQAALLEMNHKGGSLNIAEKYLKKAMEAAPWDKPIKHTYANYLRRKASDSRDSLARQKYRRDAKKYLNETTESTDEKPYRRYTAIQVSLDELTDILQVEVDDSDKAMLRRITEKTNDLEKNFSAARQLFPNNDKFFELESKFRNVISDSKGALRALELAFERNPRNEYVAVRISKFHESNNDRPKAIETLQKCIENSGTAKIAHFCLAKIRINNDETSELILQHLRKSFSDGDSNYDAQFWYARELFLNNKHDESRAMFDTTKTLKLPPDFKNSIRGIVRKNGENVDYEGTIEHFEENYLFLNYGTNNKVKIFTHAERCTADIWEKITPKSQIVYNLGFTMRGAQAVIIRIKE
ncbi:SIR2 family protein [Coraliomargarita sp. SDUM461003]|uniref:SIR2 family protein n=1 Tax=Thalassobacterium maritimum TaxID=3041265 RepID=A0ABU1AYN9_9BACT|nr:SIR2 family protein [Coraliomargarita sp. SDUM461003]MDQ8208235.1 SIR2 family protein [Coraliomargarita sp. SDUM461003]